MAPKKVATPPAKGNAVVDDAVDDAGGASSSTSSFETKPAEPPQQVDAKRLSHHGRIFIDQDGQRFKITDIKTCTSATLPDGFNWTLECMEGQLRSVAVGIAADDTSTDFFPDEKLGKEIYAKPDGSHMLLVKGSKPVNYDDMCTRNKSANVSMRVGSTDAQTAILSHVMQLHRTAKCRIFVFSKLVQHSSP